MEIMELIMTLIMVLQDHVSVTTMKTDCVTVLYNSVRLATLLK